MPADRLRPAGSVRVGCCGFPVGRRRYAQNFSVVEVQQTFYQPPEPRTLARWRAELPAPFEFTLKAWQLITHAATSPTYRRLREKISPRRVPHYGSFQPTEEVWAAWERTAAAARVLAARGIVFQCPASFTPSAEHLANLRAFFGSVERGELRFAWEPRGEWPAKLVAQLCRELDLTHAVDPFGVGPQGKPFKQSPVAGALGYFRLHGRTGYRYRYTDADLRTLAEWCRGPRTSYVLFNNLTMFEDARRLQHLLAPPWGGRRIQLRGDRTMD